MILRPSLAMFQLQIPFFCFLGVFSTLGNSHSHLNFLLENTKMMSLDSAHTITMERVVSYSQCLVSDIRIKTLHHSCQCYVDMAEKIHIVHIFRQNTWRKQINLQWNMCLELEGITTSFMDWAESGLGQTWPYCVIRARE